MAAGLTVEGKNSRRPRAGTVARTGVPVCSLDERVGVIAERVRAAGWDVAVVVDSQNVVLGFLRTKELEGDPNRLIEDAMRPGPSTYRPYVPIKEVADHMTKHSRESSPITTSDGKLVGVLFRDDAVLAAQGCPDCARKMI